MSSRSFVAAACLGLLASFTLHAQSVEWASLIHGVQTESINALCHDANGNIYATGRMSSRNIDGLVVPVSGTYDIFLAKYNASGECQWVVTPGGSDANDINEGDWGWDVVYDDLAHAIYLCGTYQAMVPPPATFGPGMTVFGTGSFLAKYDTSGTCLWMRASDNGLAQGIAVDESGAVYVNGGSTNAPTTFFGPPAITVPTGPFIAKYTSEGQLIWAKSPGHGVGGKIRIRGNHLYFGGATAGSERTFLGTNLPDDPEYISFLAEVDTSFTTIQWMDLYGTSNSVSVMEMDIAESGELLLSGSFRDSLFLPSDTLVETLDGYGQFCFRTDAEGEVIWAMSYAAETLHARAVSAAPDGSSYVGIAFSGDLSTPFGTLAASNIRDFAILHLGPDGEFIGSANDGPVGPGRSAIQATADNGVVIGYPTWGPIDLGNGHVLDAEVDVFVAKLGAITSVESLTLNDNGQLLIYANPNQGTCSIELPQALQGESDLMLRILDTQGRLVQQSPLAFENGIIRLDIRAQAKGTYVAEVGNARRRYTGRIVFE